MDDRNDTPPGFGRRLRNHPRAAVLGVAVIALLVSVGTYVIFTDDTTDKTDADAAFEFAECMRDQGIDDFPDPTIGSDGEITFQDMSEQGATEEELEAANEACQHLPDQFAPEDEGQTGDVDTAGDELAANGWEEVTPGGDCECADGSEYSFYAREASTDKVVLFLDGGGGCWSAETCAPDGALYQRTIDAPSAEGVLDFDNARNPFADYSFVYVPYCTGDVHLGDATTEYTADLTVRHKGYANGTAALDHLVETFPDATEVVVIGISAGSVSAPHYAGLVSNRLPESGLTVIADSSGAFPDSPEFNDLLTGSAWGATEALSDVPSDLRSIPGLTVAAAQRHPDIVFARYDHAFDGVQEYFVSLLGGSADDLLGLIDANEAKIRDAGVEMLSYIAPGDDHLVFDVDKFYSESVDGTDLVDWTARVVKGEPVDDVRCTDCTTQ